MCAVARAVATKVATSHSWSDAMKLTEEQSRELFRRTGNYLKEACDRCGKPLAEVRYTRRGEPGEWCSAECRDGVAVSAPTLKAAAKKCLECGVPLHGKRSDSEFCSRTHLMRHRRRTQTGQNCENSGNTPIGKQGLMDDQNSGPMNTLTPSTQAL